MQRLRSTFNLLSDENPQILEDRQENPYNHLEKSSWSQILLSEKPPQDNYLNRQICNECVRSLDEHTVNEIAAEFQTSILLRSDQQDELRKNILESVHQNSNLEEIPLDVSSITKEYVIMQDEHRSSPRNRFEQIDGGFEPLQSFVENGESEKCSSTCNECKISPDDLRGNISHQSERQADFEHRHNTVENVHQDFHPVAVSPDVSSASNEYVIPSNNHRSNNFDRFGHDVLSTFEHQHNILKNWCENDRFEEVSLSDSECMGLQDYYDTLNARVYRNNILDQEGVFEHRRNTSQQSDEWTSTGHPEEALHDMSSTSSQMSYAFDIPLSGTLYEDTYTIPVPYPVINPIGYASLILRHLVRVDISPNGTIYVHNFPGQSVVSLSSNKICIYHPNSRIFTDGLCFHVTTCQNRIAKICPRGIVFSSSSRSLAYRVDESGTKTTADKFLKLRDDLPTDVFYDNELVFSLEECSDMVRKSTHMCNQNRDTWVIGGIQVEQDCYGNIKVLVGRRIVRILPVIGEISVETAPFFSISVGCYSKRYLTVQVGNMKVTSGVCGLIVRNGSQKSGLDHNGKVVIF